MVVVLMMVVGITAGHAALVPANSIGDYVWYDANRNGLQETSEDGIPGVTVVLTGDTNGDGIVDVTLTRVTNSLGKYLFSSLKPGNYTVTVIPPAGMTQTFDYDGLATPHAASLSLALGQTNLDIDFGYVHRCAVGDFVWYDVNGDGVQDSGEPGLSGVTVTLIDGNGVEVASTTTDGDGYYYFDWLRPGTYSVVVDAGDLPAGIDNPTFDYDGVGTPHIAVVTLAAGEINTQVDFGYTAIGEVGDRVWNDVNGDGVQDAGEVGLEGVTVTLKDANGTTVATTQTGADGLYLFGGLPAGTYTVCVDASTLPAGLNMPTYDLDGISTAHMATFTLGLAESKLDVDFGYMSSARVSISGTVYFDANADGILDSGEPGLAGVTVTLKDAQGNVVATTTTASDGSYAFTDLLAGNYTVVETDPAGYFSTNALPGLGGSKVDNNTINVAATTPGTHYPNQDFLDTGSEPSITLEKTGPAEACYGQTIAYTFVVTNTGNTWLFGGLTVKDPMLGGTIWHKTPVKPGESFTFSVPYTIPCDAPNPLVNTATAIGCPPTGGTVTATSTWTVILKKCDDRPYQTQTQGGWGSKPSGGNPGALLVANFPNLYPSGLTIGSISGNTMKFTSAKAIETFLPTGGTASFLTKSYVNPTKKTEAGIFAGQVLALQLNCDFSTAGIFRPGLLQLKVKSGLMAGKTVAEVLQIANEVLGGNTDGLPYSISQLNDVVTKINENYVDGTTDKGYLIP
jgi:uncharacterized repeat protein (TIGR01451 family)